MEYERRDSSSRLSKTSMQTFPRRNVERSFRKFEDIISDLLQATLETWGTFFTHMVEHCESDPVMQVITEPLRNNPKVNIEAWYQDFNSNSFYTLPSNDDNRTALLYQFFLKLERNEVDFTAFCLQAYGHGNYAQMVSIFNTQLLSKFAREVLYRLNDILEDVRGEQDVTREAMLVFQNFGGIHGSNVAMGNSQVTGSSANITEGASGSELVQILEQARPNLHTLPAEEQQEAEEYVDGIIAEQKEGGSVNKAKAFAKSLMPMLQKAGETLAAEFIKEQFKLHSGG